MFGKFFIGFSITLDHFFSAFFKGAQYLFGPSLFLKFPFNHKKIGIVFYVLRRDGIKVALAKAQVVNGVQNISLAHPVIAHQTVDYRVEFQGLGIEILVID